MTDTQVSISVRLFALIAASWAMSTLQMSGGNMGAATDLGSFAHFFPQWVTMMAAMMLPGAATPLLRQGSVRAAPPFLLSYLGVWAATGILAYVAYRPHSSTAAGAIIIIAGLYELTPLKRHCRRQCKVGNQSGAAFGIFCLGSTVGLMAVLLAISPMSLAWMAAITVIALAEKTLPTTWPVESLLALTLIALGIWIFLDPSTFPGLSALS